MSTDQVAAARPVAQKPIPMQIYVEGKITRQRRHENKFYTVVTAAAPAVYTQPSTIEVRSPHQLGQENDIVKIVCKLSGFVRQFDYTERNTGIRKKGDEFIAILDVIAG